MKKINRRFYLNLAVLICFLMVPNLLFGQKLVTSDFLQRVFLVRYIDSIGTTFLIEHNSKNYFVTAKHLLKHPSFGQQITIEIYKESQWFKMSGIVYTDTLTNVDIAVIEPSNFKNVYSAFKIESTNLALGDEGYFLGFPYGFSTLDKSNLNDGFPFPLIKQAVLSGIYPENGITYLLLDGHNNPGFSGGPVLFLDPARKSYHLAGIVTSYYNQKNEMVVFPDWKWEYYENSGIIIAPALEHLINILDQVNIP